MKKRLTEGPVIGLLNQAQVTRDGQEALYR
ncbi:Uncharacterised protein [Pandoraea pulmonicola]|uniref:Uncharacterized protein n=1 Tax=Pandoraea pulmonicola TaxID=93221 RepID=A0AAJ5D2U7_PANPU|nr:Uncharacterised protein [Pandoraea pulmonicola]